ncbi:hypothetical protein ONS96_004002 [Cadophora gregata f. sp. sojae]|nr:hypothetical protein ONS96_004002 [Cadophora gregata f. sp. sojae]
MRGCIIGWGADTGGSIRVPAMCNGVFGIKQSNGRLPAGGGPLISPDGMSRCSIPAVVGPLARSVDDISYVMREATEKAWMWGEDCLSLAWNPESDARGSGPKGEFVFGILRGDGNCVPLPPMSKILDEVKAKLNNSPGVKAVEVSTPPAWTKCQSVMAKLMGADGGAVMRNLLEATGEPLVPWMVGKLKRSQPKTLHEVAELQAKRTKLEREMMGLWAENDGKGGKRRKIDAIVCLVAPHPVPEIERYNAAGYTSSWTLLDYPAGVVPVRNFCEQDLELGKPLLGSVISTWDERNRLLWDEKTVDRRVYLGTPLSVQVVTPRLQDGKLVQAMLIVDNLVHDMGSKSML